MITTSEFLSQISDPDSIVVHRNWRDLLLRAKWDDETWRIYNENRILETRRRIAETIKLHELTPKITEIAGRKIFILSSKDTADLPIAQEVLERIARQAIITEKKGILNDCYDIAQAACEQQGFTGRISTDYGTEYLIGWINHCINWHELSDSVIAFDLTTIRNIQGILGLFDVLVMRSSDLPTLSSCLATFYGGEWMPMHLE